MFWNKTKESHPDGIDLGDLVKDKITGFEGVVECISEWLNSCRRITIRPVGLRNESPIPSETFDAPQLEIVTAGYFDRPVISDGQKTGGPPLAPVRND